MKRNLAAVVFLVEDFRDMPSNSGDVAEWLASKGYAAHQVHFREKAARDVITPPTPKGKQ